MNSRTSEVSRRETATFTVSSDLGVRSCSLSRLRACSPSWSLRATDLRAQEFSEVLCISQSMAAHAAPASLDTLAVKAGVSPYLIKYLRERGLVSVGAVALLSPDPDHFSRTLVSPPLKTGWAGSQTYQLTSEEVSASPRPT